MSDDSPFPIAHSPPLSVIGKARRRVDGRAKVMGQTIFADDIVLPRMLYAKLLRSHLPHARIVSIDTSRAQAAPGVTLVLTGEQFPIPYGIMPVSQDEHALCQGMSMDFGRTIVDTKWTDIAPNSFDHGISCNADRTKNLH